MRNTAKTRDSRQPQSPQSGSKQEGTHIQRPLSMSGKSQQPIAPTLSTMHPGKASPRVADSPESLVTPHYSILQCISHSWRYSPSATVSPRRDGGGDVWAVSSGLCQGPRLTSPGISLDRNTSGSGGPQGSKSAHIQELQRRHVLKRTSHMPQVHMRLGAHHATL